MDTNSVTQTSAQDTDERALRKVFSKLVEGMKATDVIDELYECKLLMREEYKGILDACSKVDYRTLNRRVLMAINWRPGFAAELVKIFRKRDSYLADALEEALTEVNSQPRTDPAPTPDSKDVNPSNSGSGVTSGPMSKWNGDALVALKGKLKLNVKMIALNDILETPAGGFMSRTEAQSVRAKTGDDQQMDEVIEILLGKGDNEFATYCQMLQKSNYQVWAQELEMKAKMFKISNALPGTDPAPLRGNPQAVMSANRTTHPLSPPLNDMFWPEFPELLHDFSTLVSKLSETLQTLEQPRFDSLLVYLRERLRPMVDGCFPTQGAPNLPNCPTPSELIQHLQYYNYWNYLNTDLLEGIIKCVSGVGSPLASLMAEYKERFCTEVTYTLKECERKNVKPEPPPHYTIMAVKINTQGNPLSFNLYRILQLKSLLVQKFGVNDALFAGFTEGSIVLYFFIPEEAVYSLCPKLEAKCTALDEQRVTTLVVFGHFSVDIGYQQMSLLHENWPSPQVSSLEEKVTRLKQQLKKSEVNREELSAELRKCHKIKAEPRNPSAVHSLIEQFQRAEMDGKPDVHPKPARTYRSDPVVCQLPEPCVQDDEQLQMMVKNLDKLSKEDLFQLLSQEVDTDTAQKFWEHRMSGANLIDLTSDELKEIVSLVGPRKDVQSIITDFKRTAQTEVAVHGVDATCVPMASKEIPQLNSRATSVVKVLVRLSPSETPDSQTDFSAQGQRHTIPKVQVSLSSSKRLALQVKDQSECIQTVHQSIYKLKLTQVAKDKENGVAKYRFGKPRPDTQEYVVMLVGAAGAGKSTLINGMVNYILGVDWKDDFRFKLIADEGGISQAHSLTTTITAYTIPHQQGSPFDGTLTIVDTPSFGDTKGLDRDKRIVEQIRTFFSMSGKKGIDHIHGIGFVTPAPLARLTPTQRYVFDSILAVFGKDIGKNILMMTTFADGGTPPVLEAVDEAGIGYCKSFKFNNSALYTDQAAGGQEDEVVSSFDKMFWDMGMASFKAFFKQLACMEVRSLLLTKEVLEERKQLEVIMQSLPRQIQTILGKIDTLQQEEHIMEQHKADIAANKNYKYKVKEPRIVKRETLPGQYMMNCTKCNFTCHQNCDIANGEDKRKCVVMKRDHCTVCTNQCHWSAHVSNPFWFEVQEVTVEKSYDELKKRYEAALSGMSRQENIVSMIRAEIATSYHEVFLMIRQAQQILRRLDETAIRPNPLSEVDYIDLLIHAEEMDGRPGFLQRIKCLKTVRQQAELSSTVKDDKIFEHKALKQAEKLAKAEAEKVGWLKIAATST